MHHTVFREQGADAARQVLARAKAIISDIDGVLIDANGKPLPCVRELLGMKPSALVSNNSTHTSDSIARRFTQAGVPLRAENIFLAGEYAVDFCRVRYAGKRVLVLASDEIMALAQRNLLPLRAASEAAAVLICRDRTITMDKVEAAVNAILNGAEVVLANPDYSHPAGSGLRTETGAIWESIRCQIAGPVTLHTIGKPSAPLVEKALQQLAVKAQDAVFIGDNPDTDGAAAALLGIPFIHAGGRNGFALNELLAA